MKYDMALLAVESRKRSGQFKLIEADQPSKRLVRQKGGNREMPEITHLYYLRVCSFARLPFSFYLRVCSCARLPFLLCAIVIAI